MNAVVFEHVPVADLPAAWQSRLDNRLGATVTVRIEAEAAEAELGDSGRADDPLFGMWRDREDPTDVAGYVRAIRADRFSDGASGQG